MRVLLALVVGTALLAGPARAQGLEPCSATQTIPLNFSIAGPVCPGQPLRLLVGGCGPCISGLGWVYEPPGPITVLATMDLRQCILTVCMPETLSIPLGTFAAGHHELSVQVRATVIRPDSTRCGVTETRTVAFDVPISCVPQPLPHTNVIRVGPPPPCNTCPPPPICPERPIPFFAAGTLPDNCWQFRGIQLLPSPVMSPLPTPPIARIVMAYNDCLGLPCNLVPVPWQGSAMMPPLPPGNYSLIAQLAVVSWCDTTMTPDTLYSTIVPFTVAPSCSLPPAPDCFLHAWRDAAPSPDCNAVVGPDGTARAVFAMWTGTALGGLQGRFTLDPSAMEIRNLRPVGIAQGMQLLWNARPDGAEFVLFSTDGRPLRSPCIPPAACPPGADPVIEVTLGPRPGVPTPPRTALDVRDLLASDTLGREVRECPTFAPIPPAWICAHRRLCDANGDGRLDVRDLVLLARCIRGIGPCPDSTLARLDCDGDGGLDVDDVLCCARLILRGHLPDSLVVRPAPGLHASVGQPTAVAGGAEVRVRLSGADLVGAARLAFAYPAGSYDASSVTVLGDASQWLALTQLEYGELVLGLVALAPAEAMPSSVELVIRLDAASGSSQPAAVSLAGSEFVAPDGAVLAPGPVSTPPGVSRFELSAARPNPFRRDTRFELSLSEGADVDLGVFDLAGRRIATLHRGPLAAGDHGFRWNGQDDQGARVRDGIYFYRVRNGAIALTRRLVLIGDR